MATIKSFTDLEQSKRLAGILPPESADMHYWRRSWQLNDYAIYPSHSEELQKQFEAKKIEYIPCWSQAALYNMLPVIIGNVLEKNALRLRIDKGKIDFNVWYDNLDTGSAVEDLDIVESNPVDAYYKMIIKLHERKLI